MVAMSSQLWLYCWVSQSSGMKVRDIDDLALLDEAAPAGPAAGSRRCRGLAARPRGRDRAFEFLVADVLDVDAGGFFESCHRSSNFTSSCISRTGHRRSLFVPLKLRQPSPCPAVRHDPPAQVASSRDRLPQPRLAGQDLLDLVQSGVQISCTGDLVGHALPERASTHFAGHQVGPVEAEAGGVVAPARRRRAPISLPYIPGWRSGAAASAPPPSSQPEADCGTVKYSINARTSGRSLNIAMMSPATRKGLP